MAGKINSRHKVRRSRLFPIKRQAKPGSAPGTMISPVAAMSPVIDILAFGPDRFVESTDAKLGDIATTRLEHPVTWVNVTGLGNAELIADIGDLFGLHRLAMEDVLNIHQRPKVEEFDSHIFLVTRIIHDEGALDTEQVSIFLGSDYVLSFQERVGDCLDPLRDRVRRGKGRVRFGGPDYLAYSIIDAVLDDYFPILERYGEKLEALETDVIYHPDSEHIAALHDMKRSLLTLRRSIWPHREMVNSVIRDENPLISAETRVYLRDTYDHSIQLMDVVETYREIASGLVDVYMSSVSAKLNEIMKVLTIIATIFMPLGFLASLYGMNFDRSASPWNMPELGWRLGYPFSLLLMSGAAIGMLIYFRRKGWLGGRRSKAAHRALDRQRFPP